MYFSVYVQVFLPARVNQILNRYIFNSIYDFIFGEYVISLFYCLHGNFANLMNNPEMRLRTMKRNGFTWYHYWSAILFRFYNNEEICLLRRKRGISRVKFLLAIPCLMNSYRLKFWYDVHRSIILCRLCTRYYIIFYYL